MKQEETGFQKLGAICSRLLEATAGNIFYCLAAGTILAVVMLRLGIPCAIPTSVILTLAYGLSSTLTGVIVSSRAREWLLTGRVDGQL